jgi:hypothetical protein
MGMDLGRRGEGITDKEWEVLLAENQALMADEQAKQRAAYSGIWATDFAYGDFPTGEEEKAQRLIAAAAITKTQPIQSADYTFIGGGGFKKLYGEFPENMAELYGGGQQNYPGDQSPSWEQRWEEPDPNLAGYSSIFPQTPTGFSTGPPGSGGQGRSTFYDPIVGATAQQMGDVKPRSFATVFAEHEPEFRSQFKASPQFQLRDRSKELRQPRTFVI